MQFIDADSFNVRRLKKTCVHIVQLHGRQIPFDTYNLFYRDVPEQIRLAPLRRRVEATVMVSAPVNRQSGEAEDIPLDEPMLT